jgi:hypothetical protein
MTEEEFLAVVKPVAELVGKKSQDYGTALEEVEGWIIRMDEYFPFEHRSYVQMIWTKALRLLSLTKTGQTRKPNFEGIEDTVNDMIAYLVFYRDYLNRKKK